MRKRALRQSVSRMKTDSNSFGIDTAALLRGAYSGCRLSTLVDYHIQDT